MFRGPPYQRGRRARASSSRAGPAAAGLWADRRAPSTAGGAPAAAFGASGGPDHPFSSARSRGARAAPAATKSPEEAAGRLRGAGGEAPAAPPVARVEQGLDAAASSCGQRFPDPRGCPRRSRDRGGRPGRARPQRLALLGARPRRRRGPQTGCHGPGSRAGKSLAPPPPLLRNVARTRPSLCQHRRDRRERGRRSSANSTDGESWPDPRRRDTMAAPARNMAWCWPCRKHRRSRTDDQPGASTAPPGRAPRRRRRRKAERGGHRAPWTSGRPAAQPVRGEVRPEAPAVHPGHADAAPFGEGGVCLSCAAAGAGPRCRRAAARGHVGVAAVGGSPPSGGLSERRLRLTRKSSSSSVFCGGGGGGGGGGDGNSPSFRTVLCGAASFKLVSMVARRTSRPCRGCRAGAGAGPRRRGRPRPRRGGRALRHDGRPSGFAPTSAPRGCPPSCRQTSGSPPRRRQP